PLPPDRAVDHSISGLNHEANRVRSIFESFDRGERGVNDQRVFVLKLEPVAPPARVAVDDEGEPVDAGRIFFARQRRAWRFDRANRLVDRFRRERRLVLRRRVLGLWFSDWLCLRIFSGCERGYAKQPEGRWEEFSEHILSYIF